MQKINKNCFGMSLLEVSVVMVIIGLLVSAIMAGRSVVKNSQLQSIVTQVEEYRSNVKTFQGIYNKYPGDFNNAQAFWPAASNGDGDNNIEVSEMYQFWLHLSLAEIISGSFSGSGSESIIGTNVPESSIETVGIDAIYTQVLSAAYGSRNYFMVGKENAGTILTSDSFSAADAYYIDITMDDGDPDTGLMQAGTFVVPACTSGGEYIRSETSPACLLFFEM